MIVKVCGMRDIDNINAVVNLGIRYIGVNCYRKSSRYVSERIPASDKYHRIGVFVNENISVITDMIISNRIDSVQLHGNESENYLRELKKTIPNTKIIKAISIGNEKDINLCGQYENTADLFLFDTKCDAFGGCGRKFNWDYLEKYTLSTPFLLAGGIDIEDVQEINEIKHPKFIGIDINSRFEDAPALKNINKIKSFLEKLNYEQN